MNAFKFTWFLFRVVFYSAILAIAVYALAWVLTLVLIVKLW